MGKKNSNYIKFCDNLSFTPRLITMFFFCHLKKNLNPSMTKLWVLTLCFLDITNISNMFVYL